MSISKVEEEVLKHFPGVKPEQLRERCKKDKFVKPKHIIYYIAYDLYNVSFATLARAYNRHHSSVMKSIESTQGRLEVDKAFKEKVDSITLNLL